MIDLAVLDVVTKGLFGDVCEVVLDSAADKEIFRVDKDRAWIVEKGRRLLNLFLEESFSRLDKIEEEIFRFFALTENGELDIFFFFGSHLLSILVGLLDIEKHLVVGGFFLGVSRGLFISFVEDHRVGFEFLLKTAVSHLKFYYYWFRFF